MTQQEIRHFKSTNSFQELKKIKQEIAHKTLRELFSQDDLLEKNRVKQFSLEIEDFYLDYSKNHINFETFQSLIKLAEETGVKNKIERMFSGELINWTEKRAVLHTALRSFSTEPLMVKDEQGNDEDVMLPIRKIRDRMKDFSNQVRSGQFVGSSGKKIKNVVNIGIGGSFLGPKMVAEALKDYHDVPALYFISNVDGSDLQHVLRGLNPEETLFLIASKTFTTEETMANAELAKAWVLNHYENLSSVIQYHFAAMSTNEKAVKQFGIDESLRFEFWDFVGGRFSTWSSIGLGIAIAVGYDRFEEFLKGGEEMDNHFKTAPFEKNLPVILALLTVWYIEFWGYTSYANLPYAQLLVDFSPHLQQLDMESNGKRVNHDGAVIDYLTAPVTWGTVGTNGQHSFYQLIHQGQVPMMIDFLGVVKPNHSYSDSHDKLMANLFAQSEALAFGLTWDEVKMKMEQENIDIQTIELLTPHRTFPGNKPSNTLLIDKITPRSIGKLLSLYEHRTAVMGMIWDINSFDQWGVELGKINSKNILKKIKGGLVSHSKNNSDSNSSTEELITRYLGL